jgi:hypothetical protein
MTPREQKLVTVLSVVVATAVLASCGLAIAFGIALKQ